MAKINSRSKGARFERALASILRVDYGYDCRRGQQYSGANGDADVVGLPGIHIEAKHREKLNVHDAMAQAVRDATRAAADDMPAVFHKRNNTDVLVTMRLADWMMLYAEWEAGEKLR